MPTVLITGAARGIGRATALRLASQGWQVYAGVRNQADGADLQREARMGELLPVPLDVTDADQLAGLDAALPQRLDAVLNDAGIVVDGPIEAVTPDDLRRQLDVNVVGQAAVTQAVLPRIRASRGRIVFVSSLSGRVATPFMGAYSASKFALEALADALRIEMRPWGIKVILVEPSSTVTDLWKKALDTLDGTEARLRPEHRELYSEQFAGLRKSTKLIQKQAVPVGDVVAVIERALTARRPRPRYPVGVASKVQLVASAVLPTAISDAALARIAGPTRRRGSNLA
jgi:NAD(P)-dependent dehydrogenase (short-subunit alcohol dehydrogenase family)